MIGVLLIAVLSCIFRVLGGACTFPDGSVGTWKSSNYGTFIFGSDSMYMSTDITGNSKRNYTCESNSGTKYVIRTKESFLPFTGATTSFYAYVCLDLRETSAYSYYYYQQSQKDIGFNYERAKPFNKTGISLNAVCETTVDVTEYHVMVKEGFGKSLQLACPDIFLGVFYYNYNDMSGSYCSSVSKLDVCNSNKTTLIFNYTLCSKMVGFSASGIMGCVASVTNGYNTYLTTYNHDSAIDGLTTTTFACFAATTVGSSVVASVKQTECDVNQSPTTLPTGGEILQLTANCLPVSTTPESTNYTRIIVGGVLGSLAVVGIILFLIYYLCFWRPKKRSERRIGAETLMENDMPPSPADEPTAVTPYYRNTNTEQIMPLNSSKTMCTKQQTEKASLEWSWTEIPISESIRKVPALAMSDPSVKCDFPERRSMSSTQNSQTTTPFSITGQSQDRKRRKRRGYPNLRAARSHSTASRLSKIWSTRRSVYDRNGDKEDGEWEDEEVKELEHSGIVRNTTVPS